MSPNGNEPRRLAPWASRPASAKRLGGRRGNLLATGAGDLDKLAGLARWKRPTDAEQPRRAAAGRPESDGGLAAELAARGRTALDANPLALGPVPHRGMAIASEPDSLPMALGGRPVVIAANHGTEVDHALLLSRLPMARRRRTVLVCARGDEIAPAILLRFPVIRLDPSAPGAAGMRVVRRLQRGWTALVFAEGVASRDGALGGFSTLPVELARRAEVPLLPAAIRGAFAAENRRTAGRAGQGRVAVRFGDPIDVAGGDADALTGKLRAAVAALLAEDATSWWDARREAATDRSVTTDDNTTVAADPGRRSAGSGGNESDENLWRRVWEHTAQPRVGGAAESRRIWR